MSLQDGYRCLVLASNNAIDGGVKNIEKGVDIFLCVCYHSFAAWSNCSKTANCAFHFFK
jgi:hypothetical protein